MGKGKREQQARMKGWTIKRAVTAEEAGGTMHKGDSAVGREGRSGAQTMPAPAKGHAANRVWQSEENNVEARMGTFRCEMACATRWRVTSRC